MRTEKETADLSATLRSGRDDNSSWERNLAFPNKLVIPTGAYPDFLPRCTRQDHVCAFRRKGKAHEAPHPNAARFHGKYGVA